LGRSGRAGTLGDVATILLAGVDLFFRWKLEGLLPDHRLVTTDAVEEPELVIADISRTDPIDVADAYPDIPLIGFTSHTDTAGLRRAHEAGFDQVLAKSALMERAPTVVARLLLPIEESLPRSRCGLHPARTLDRQPKPRGPCRRRSRGSPDPATTSAWRAA